MQALGVEYKNSDGSLKSVKQVLADLAPAFNKVDDSQRLAAASTIFGKDQAAKMVQVLGTYNDAMALADKLNREAAGSIEKEVAAKLALAENHVKRTDEAFRQPVSYTHLDVYKRQCLQCFSISNSDESEPPSGCAGSCLGAGGRASGAFVLRDCGFGSV